MSKFGANRPASQHNLQAVRSEKCLSALLASDTFDYKNLSAEERENLYHACCWLCAGLVQCDKRKSCSIECCKGSKSTARMQGGDGDSRTSLAHKRHIIAVASLFHPEIASKFDHALE